MAFKSRIEDLKTQMMMNHELVFFAQILLQCSIVEDTSIPTACINGIEMRINPEWFMTLEADNQKAQYQHQLFVLVHEALHPAFRDMARMQGRDPQVWNMAVDYVNNAFIHTKMRNVHYPLNSNYLLDSKFDGLEKEEVYNLLMEDTSLQKNCALSKDMQGDGPTEDNTEVLAKIDQIVDQAAAIAEACNAHGSIPDTIKKYLEEKYAPKLNWIEYLSQCYTAMCNKEDYSYRKIHPLYLAQGLYYPSLYSESVGKIGIAFDTSYSCTDDDVATCFAFIRDIWETTKPSEIEVIGFTTEVVTQFNFSAGDSLDDLNFRTGGGTCIKPVLKHFKDSDLEMLIVFTDMEFHMPNQEPNYPTIWVNLRDNGITSPFGINISV